VDAEAEHKVTPLMLAVANGRSAAVSLLLQKGADPEKAAANGARPLLYAVEKGQEDVVAALLAGGADPEIKTRRKDTPLFVAAQADDADMVRVLLEGGADVRARNWTRDTALIEAVRYGRRKVVPELLAAGADVNRKGGSGDSALKMARKFEDETLVALLEGRESPDSGTSHRASPAPGSSGSAEALRIEPGKIQEPRRLKHVLPEYPRAMMAGRVQGVVILEAVIDKEGRVLSAKLLRAPNPAFGPPSVDAVRQWRYTPTLLNGVAVPVIMTVTVDFKLSSRRAVPRAVPGAASHM